MGHRAHRGWIQRGEEKTSKCLIIFYLRERKSLIIIAVEWWRPLFSRIRGLCEYEVYSGYGGLCGLRSAPLVLQLPGWRLGLRLRHLRCPGDSGPSAFQRPGARGLGFTVVNPTLNLPSLPLLSL